MLRTPISLPSCLCLGLALGVASSAQQGGNVCGPAAPNSTGVASVLMTEGSAVVAENDLTLTCTQLPQNTFGMFIVGDGVNFIPNPGGSAGFLCVGGTIGRFLNSVGNTGAAGTAQFSVDLTALPAGAMTVAAQPGEAWYFQYWHRDTGAAGPTSNFSPGREVVFAPAVPTFRDDVWPMLASTNIGAPACIICHSASNPPGGLDLGFTADMAYAALVNVASTSGNCGGRTYVVPGDPAASLLYDKLANPAPACGAPMPFGGTFAGDLPVIREWIQQGAQL